MRFLRKRVDRIGNNQIQVGQVLEIDYANSGRAMIIVTQTSSQNRFGNVSALKLKNLSEKEVFNMIMTVRHENRNNKNIYDAMEKSEYVTGIRYYNPKKIKYAWKVTMGNSTNVPTRKVHVGNSVLYGVAHGNHVFVHENDWDTLESELLSKRATFYEGYDGHEAPVEELIHYLIGNTAYTSNSWDIDDAPILSLFGGDTDTILEQIRDIMEERELTYSGRVVDILANTSGRVPGNGSSWGANKLSANDIIKIINLGKPTKEMVKGAVALDATPLYINVTSQEEFENIFRPFHMVTQKYAFAKDWRKDKPEVNHVGEFVARTPLEILARNANLERDVYLVKLMKETPGVYFAGEGHIHLVRLVIRAQQMGVNI
jgi:hypothetical protein